MPKLKKSSLREESQDQQSYGKYLRIEQKQTQIPIPIDENEPIQKSSPQKKVSSSRKLKKSLKKSHKKDEQNILPNQGTVKRKSRKKKIDISPQKSVSQNEQEHGQISPKKQRKQKSLRKQKKSSKKNKNTHSQQQSQKSKQVFNDNQLRQKVNQSNQILEKREFQQDQVSNKNDSQISAVNFNKRLKKKKPVEKQDMNILLSRYTEDEGSTAFGNKITQDDSSNGQIGTRYQSDLRDLDILVKKKQKKPKKEKQIRIKNKYFSDISLSQQNKIQEKNQFESQDPPQNSEQLIIQKKEPRKTIHNLNEVIQKRVNHIKDRRQFKNSQGDIKFKNHIKTKLQQVKDAQQVQVDIQIPNFFTKKTASAALYMKNTLQNEEKISRINQANPQNEKKLQKTSSNLDSNKLKQVSTIQQRKNHQFMLKMKKKGVKRDDFYNHLTKQIKSKRHTDINSQQIKDCFKTSNLDGQNFDVQFAQDVLSNCSSRSASKQSFSKLQRRMSIDSQKSLKSQQSIKSNNPKKVMNQNSLNGSITKVPSKWNIEMNEQPGQNSNSKSAFTNKSSKHVSNFMNPPISQVKESDASSSYRNISDSRSFGVKAQIKEMKENSLRFDNKPIKEEVQRSFQKTYEIFQTDNQLQQQKTYDLKKFPKHQQIQTVNDILIDQRNLDERLEKKLKQIVKTTNEKKPRQKKIQSKEIDLIDDLLGDGFDEEKQSKQQKRNKKKNKNKKKKQKSQQDDYQSYFQVEAQYSSSQEGHSDQQFQTLDQDLDEEGNIIGLIDKDTKGLKLNQKRIKKKFLEDEQKRDQEMIQKIMKGLYGRKKLEQTDSEKRLRKRMQQAAKKNLLDDLDQINGSTKNIETLPQPQNLNQEKQKYLQRQNQNEQNLREMRKLKEMQQQLAIGGHGRIQNQGINGKQSSINEAWKLINPSLPVKKTIHPTMINRQSIVPNRVSVDRNKQQRKSIFDTKKGSVQQQIFNKTITTDRSRADSTGNRNKLQKTSQIHLDIRNNNGDCDDQIQI